MNRKFILLILGLLALVFIAQWRMPRHFNWTPTYSHGDGQPFGCLVFDSVLAASMPCGYSVTRQSLWQLQRDSAFMASPHGLIIHTEQGFDEASVRQLRELTKAGHVVMIVGCPWMDGLDDSLGIAMMWNGHFSMQRYLTSDDEAATITWRPDAHETVLPASMIERIIHVDDSVSHEVLATVDSLGCVALSFPMGRGQLIVASTPLLMTNYGMLHDGIRGYISRLMGRMGSMPVVRTEAYMKGIAQTEQSPFYVLLQRPPLRWALYLTVLTVLCLMIFTARRRQRVIPVVAPPKNANLELVRLVGTLAWQQGDHRGLVERKLQYAAEVVRRLTGIDLLTAEADELHQLARLSGLTYDELRLRIANAREATTGHHVVTPEEMRAHIDNLNDIIRRISGTAE